MSWGNDIVGFTRMPQGLNPFFHNIHLGQSLRVSLSALELPPQQKIDDVFEIFQTAIYFEPPLPIPLGKINCKF